jgi:hypothetical protein
MKRICGTILAVFLLLASSMFAQRVTGSVSVTATDPQGAVVPNAKVTVSSPDTGFSNTVYTSSNGTVELPNLAPGQYQVRIEGQGFATYATVVPVRVGVSTPVTAKLTVGSSATEVTVAASAQTVDTTRATVQGVITADRIQDIPLNGRNFLSLASLEPGVQIVDGGSFDPTKNQFAGVSIGGRSGRVTRIQVDGVDITDETVGTTVMNVSNESIQEFSVAQSTLDPSTEMTSSGAVNIITRSGTNSFHGSAFGFFRDARWAADQRLTKTGPKPPFDRQQFGGRVGGPFIHDRLFWHAEYEQTNQDSRQFTDITQFPQFTGAFNSPVDERMGSARLDWNVTSSLHAFYRFMHNDNVGTTGFGGIDLSAFANKNNTNTHVAGVDLSSAHWTHSIRGSYLNFNNGILSANTFAGTPETLAPGGEPVLIRISGILQDVGPDLLAPQNTFQDNKQLKYDGSTLFHSHTVRFGASYNHIEEVVFASFFGLAPRIRGLYSGGAPAFADNNYFGTGGRQNPLNFAVNQIVFGNGQGAFSERSALGFKRGGTVNERFGAYLQDSWRATQRLTLNFGLRWTYNSMLYDSDLPRASVISLFDPNLGGIPSNPKNNFGPQVGFAWNVGGNGRTVVRGGAGVFYETNIINNVLFDRPINLPPGFGNDTPVLNSSSPTLLDPRSGAVLVDFSTACAGLPGNPGASCFDKPIGAVIPLISTWQNNLQGIYADLNANWPPPGVAPLIEQIRDAEGSLVDPNVHTPYGAQFNIGVQHELRPGLVLSVDYLHNRGVHFNLVQDLNRIGAANTLDPTIAQDAITGLLTEIGCADIDCAIAGGATISDFADFGLGSGSALDSFAYRGMNPNFRGMGTIRGIGLSRFQALQARLTGRVGSFGPVRDLALNVNYQLGRFESTGADQDFISTAGNNDRPTAFYGPANQDRLHQFGVSFQMRLPLNFFLSTATSIRSPRHTSLFLPPVSGGADEIFFSDTNGDGVSEDWLPGVKPRGALGVSVKNVKELNARINAYNTQVAGTLLPAARALVDAGLFTETQLKQLGATAGGCTYDATGTTITNQSTCFLATAPEDQILNDNFINTDLRFSNRIHITENMMIEPMVEIFNVFNVANYAALGSTLDATAGSPNGTGRSLAINERGLNRLGFGSGSFSPGTQRAFQFGIRFTF